MGHKHLYQFRNTFFKSLSQDEGIYTQTVPLYLQFEDKDKDVTCSLDDKDDNLHDSVAISSVILFDASQCPHCTFDPTGEFAKSKKNDCIWKKT